MKVIYVQPRTDARQNYRSGDGTEQIWTPWWALLLHQHGAAFADEARLIDARIDPTWLDELERELDGDEDAVVAVSVMTGHAIRDAIEASRFAREAGATVCWGGPHPTLFPNEVSDLPYVDTVVRGFGAAAFGRLLAARSAGETGTPIVESRGTECAVPVVVARKSAPAADFRPVLSLVSEWQLYANSDHAIGDRVVNLITSEGCLRRCTFCSEPTTSKNSWLIYNIGHCVEAAKFIVDAAAANGVKLHDPNFLQNISRGLHFGQVFEREVGLPWAATIHPADLLELPEHQLAELARSGLRRVLVGLESSDQQIVDLAGKRFPVDRIPDIGRKLAAHDIAGMFTFIVGWPDADPGHYRRTIDTAFGLRAIDERHQAKIHFLEPWPGTPIQRLMQRSLDLPELTIEEWADVDYYFAHHLGLHDATWENRVRAANRELSPYVDA